MEKKKGGKNKINSKNDIDIGKETFVKEKKMDEKHQFSHYYKQGKQLGSGKFTFCI